MSSGPSKPPQRGGFSTSPQTPKGGFNTKVYGVCAIALLSFFAALFYNELNIKELRAEAPERLEPKYSWVRTADDISYLRPAENYYYKGVWKDNNAGRQSYFLRTPGYGFFRYALMRMMGVERSYFYFKYIQVLLFSISALLLFYMATMAGLPFRYALIIEVIYGLSPFASGFLYYSITEGITPALMIGYCFFLLKGYRQILLAPPDRPGTVSLLKWQSTALSGSRKRVICFIAASLILGYIGITRPVLLLFGISLPLVIYWSQLPFSLGKKNALIALTGFVALAPIGIWAVRSAKIAGAGVSIYPIYYAENNSQYRPTHKAIWEFEKAYGTEGHDFHVLLVPLWQATIHGDTSDMHVDSIMMACPDFVKQAIGPQRLRNSYIRYRQCIVYQRSRYPAGTAMPDTIPDIEKRVISDFHAYAGEINSTYWLWCHIVVPIKLFKALSFHSNLSLYMFQHTYRGRWWMEAMRVAFLLLHFLCCLSFIAVFFSRDKPVKILFGLTIACYFFYLCYDFRGLEERYTLPVLPLLLVGLGLSLHSILQKVKGNFNSQVQ
jgi:hypothetical protein